jgi:hypothetical protein
LPLSLGYITIVAMGLAFLGIISLIVFIITGVTTVTADKYPYSVFQELLAILTPIIMAALVFCIPLKIILNQFIRIMKVEGQAFLLRIIDDKLSTKKVTVYLTLYVILGVAVAFIPHLSTINPNNERLGADSPRYVHWLDLMKNQTSSPIQLAFRDITSGGSASDYFTSIYNYGIYAGRSIPSCRI